MPKKKPQIKVLCVDDHGILVRGLRTLIEATEGLEFVGSLSTAEKLVEKVKEVGADVVLMDIEMPGPDPFEAMEDMHRQCPQTRAIVLSAFVRDHYIDAAVNAGAWGYLCKNDGEKVIIDAICNVFSGEFVFGPAVKGRCAVKKKVVLNGHDRSVSKLQTLTAREQQILRMIGKGMSRAEIAKTLHRSPKTIDATRVSIMEKLNIHDRVELVLYAVREGLVEA